MRRNGIPSFEELQKPLPWFSPENWRYKILSLFLKTAGQLSDGIRTGYKYGFDSGMIMNYVYENVPRGRLYVGRLLDAAFLNQITCKAFRAIKEIQKNMIKSYLRERGGREAYIVDLASGGADYIYDVLKETNRGVRVLLRDINENTLNESRKAAAKLKVEGKISYEIGDALDRESLRAISGNPDLLIEVGLYGIVHDDEVIRKHFFELKNILGPDALLFNVQTCNPQIELIARVLKNQDGERCVWHLRPVEQVIGWAEQAGFRSPKVTMDPYGVYAVVMMRN